MLKYVISDTSCLILFDKLDNLLLLKNTYHEIVITTEVAKEFGKSLPGWINVLQVQNKNLQRELEKIVDLGEASAIALAVELNECILIIDDKRGRNLAHKLNIEITGTLGTLLKAKENGVISSVKPYTIKLREIGYRITREIEEEVLRKAKEL